MIVTKTYKFRLEPTPEQEHEFLRLAGCRRFVWNWALARKQAVYKETGKSIGYVALAAELVKLKLLPETAFLKECHSPVLQQTLMDLGKAKQLTLHIFASDALKTGLQTKHLLLGIALDKAFVSFFEKRARFPTFKSRKRTPNAFRIPQNVTLTGGKVSIPKIGRVKVRLHRAMEGTVKGATIKQEANGHWHVTFVSHIQLPDASPLCDAPVGIDVGLESFLTLDTGEKVAPPKFYRKSERKLKRLQRRLCRCQKTSRNRAKAKKQVAIFHASVCNKRNDWLHKLSARLLSRFDTFCIEDLNLKGLTRTKLAKSFSDAAIGTFLRILEYKAQWQNKRVVKVGRFFASSKTCHCCQHKQPLELCDRQWTCERCHTLHDRDINAAVNILCEGMRLLAVGITESLNADGESIRLAKVSSSR